MNNRSKSAAPVVSIIIPVFNKCDLTVQCLESIPAATATVPHEIIVVDNASTDGTPQRLAALKLSNLRVIRNETNRHFAGACNQGAAAASGKFLLFLNNDTIPVKGWLDALVEEMRSHPEVAAVGAKLLYESTLVQHAGVAYARETRNPFHPHRLLRMDDPRVNVRRELQAVTAACILIRPKWFQDCGGFKEIYRNGYEDLDLCLEIRKRGGVIVYQPKSVVIHLESQSAGRMKFDDENRALFFERWKDAILSDEDAYYFEGGMRGLGRTDWRGEEPRLARISSEAERRQWQVVAECQRAAAAYQIETVKARLTDVAAWPADAAIRRWAGSLCLHLGLADAAQKHFSEALVLADSPKLRAQLGIAANADSAAPWEAMVKAGLRALRNEDFAAAQNMLETALVRGASPRLVLPALWQAAQRNGDTAAADTARRALMTLPHVDATTSELLESSSNASASVTPDASQVAKDSPKVETVSTAPGSPKISIIILALNQLEHTKLCLESIAAHTTLPHEIIVVDNGSTDGTPQFLRDWQAGHANRIVIRNESNRGFAGGNNQALAIARGEHVVLLNNDTFVTPGWLEGMLDALQRHPKTGVVGPMSNHVSGPQWINTSYPSQPTREDIVRFAAKWADARRGQTQEVPRAVGFCLLATKAVIEKIGGLDERFGSGNFEDDDFCIRARLAGFQIRIAQDVFVHHTGSQTFKGAKIDYRQAMTRNWELFRTKWNIPADVAPERGYPVPKSLPDGAALKISLPSLSLTHKLDGDARWTEVPAARPVAKPMELPACARIGNLDEARSQFGRKEFAAAWNAAVAAIQLRPFHPEAWLLLAEIAAAAGDSTGARQCAQRARDLATNWKSPKQFLQKNVKGNAKHDWITLSAIGNRQSASGNARLTVGILTKNEEKFIAQCINSVKAIADQIIVVDTGSTDRTVEIAKSLGAEIYTTEWNDDFSAPRNLLLEHANGDWILMLDADEELPAEQHAKLRADMKRADVVAFRLPLVNHGDESHGASYVPRLFRNVTGAHYYGRIHEQVFPSIIAAAKSWNMETRIGTAQLLHHGYAKEVVKDRNKVERNLKLLRQAVAERPDDANLVMNLGLELVKSGELQTGLTHYRDAFRLMSAQPATDVVPELREVLLTQFTSHLYKIRAHDEIVQVLTSSLAKNGGLTASLHFALGLAQFELKQFRDAAEQMRQCIAKRKQTGFAPINTDILTAAPNHCLALCLAKLNDAAGAEKAFQAGFAETGRTDELKLDYARFLASQERHVDALHKLHELVQANAQNVAAWRLGGDIALSKVEFLEFAGDWTGEAMRALPNDSVIIAQRAEVMLLTQQNQAALPLWEKLCNGETAPKVLAAQILCATVESQPALEPRNNVEEIAASRAFVDWYRRLISSGARDTIMQLNTRVDALRSTLPSAARLLDGVVAEARVAQTAETAS